MDLMARIGNRLSLLALFAAAVALGGCGGVEFEGKVFDAVGLTDKKDKAEPIVKTRAPLVLPPRQGLPEPNAQQASAVPENWPDDPDERARREAEEARKKTKRKMTGELPKKTTMETFESLTGQWPAGEGLVGRKVNKALGEQRDDGTGVTETHQ